VRAIRQAIWHIEAHLEGPFSLEETAAAAGLSKYHLSRSFSFAVGLPPSAYARARRLSVAAARLAGGEGDILGLALDLGYASHEAFTRAFRDRFGRTPEQVRAKGDTSDLNLLEAQTVNTFPTLEIEPPAVSSRGPLLVAGFTQTFRFDRRGDIPSIWRKLGPHIGSVPQQRGRSAFGVCLNHGEGAEDFDYMAGVEVSTLDSLSEGMTGLRIEARRFAIYRHRGHVAEIGAVCNAAFADLASRPDLSLADGPLGLIEHYPDTFDPAAGRGGYEVWLPLS
jgi:AraC family transcriptional regulator